VGGEALTLFRRCFDVCKRYYRLG